MSEEFVDIRVGSGAIKLFERIEIPIFNAFCEFIDNSLQSYIEHEEELRNVAQTRCKVEISWTNDQIVIKDNAFGMNREAFGRAMKWNAPRDHYPAGSLSKYGMGLKYAAINLGTVWSIKTTELGSDIEFNGTVDSDYLSRENPERLPLTRNKVSVGQHYTVITITKLHKKFTEKDLKDALAKLGSIYQYFLDKNMLSIEINNNKVTYDEPKYWLDDDGNEYYEIISNGKFNFDNKTYEYTGAIGILNKGSNSKAGLTLMQNHRGITLFYKPHEIFGTGNTFMSQRIVGTIEFQGDSWIARVNKDGLLWQSSGLEERFLADLKSKENIKKLIKICGELRKRTNTKVKVTPRIVGQAEVTGLKQSYQIDETITFEVKAKEGWELKEVKWGTIMLSPDVPGTNKYVYTIPSDSPTNVLLNIKAYALQEIVDDHHTTNSDNNSGNNGGVNVIAHNPPQNPPLSFLKRATIFINNHLKSLSKQTYAYPLTDTREVYKEGVYVKLKNIDFGFELKEINNSTEEDWIDLIEKPAYARSYELTVNYASGMFAAIGLNEETKKQMLLMATIISLSRILSASNGLKKEDANILISNLNKIIKDGGCDE